MALLGNNRRVETDLHLEERADGSCEWLNQTPQFQSWLRSSSSKTQFLTMFGAMGCGKTTTTVYITELLESEGAVVCRYFCKDDGERNQAANVYRGLIGQLIYSVPGLDLDSRFSGLYEGSKDKRDTSKLLRSCFVQLLQIVSDKLKVYIVIDAVDECEKKAWEELVHLFKDLSGQRSPSKVFLSSRHAKDIKRGAPGNSFEMRLSRDESRRISKHLMDTKYFQNSDISEKDRHRLVEKAFERAEGSAIWIRNILAYVDMMYSMKTFHSDVETLLRAMENTTSAESGLPALYGKLYVKHLERHDKEPRKMELALNLLAFARRPVTLRELACFLSFHFQGEDALSKLNSKDYLGVFDLVHPFVNTDGKPDSVVRLVHQSLKALIAQKPPSSWAEVEISQDEQTPEERQEQIRKTLGHQAGVHRILASACLRYLKLPRCSEKRLISSGFTHAFHPWGSAPEGKPVQDFDPAKEGFGDLFNYAACHWKSHLSKCPSRAEDAKDIISICKAGSTSLQNWSDQYRRPTCSFSADETFLPTQDELDPLVISVVLELQDMPEMIMKDQNVWTSPAFRNSSAANAIDHALLKGHFSTAITIFTLSGDRMCKRDYWDRFMRQYHSVSWENNGISHNEQGWSTFINTLIKAMLPTHLPPWAPHALHTAITSRCLLATRALFSHAATNPPLHHALLSNPHHQSLIALAAATGNPETLAFLCAQHTMTPHLHHRGPNAETAFHAAATSDHFDPRILATLIAAWPAGVDLPSSGSGIDDATPLLALARCDTGAPGYAQAARMLLETGDVDVEYTSAGGGFALGVAVEKGRVGMVEVLVGVGGARLERVVERGGGEGVRLREGVEVEEGEGVKREGLGKLGELVGRVRWVDGDGGGRS